MDELFESLTLVQTGKIHNFPIILFGRAYWAGLVDWIRGTMLAEGKVSPDDVRLLVVTDSAQDAARLIVDSFKERSWIPPADTDDRENSS